EVAASDVADPDAVPLPDRVVEVEVLAEDLALLRGGLATEHALGDVTRQDAREHENERRDDEQRADGKCEALGDESENHTSSCKSSWTVSRCAPRAALRGRPGNTGSIYAVRVLATCT